MVILHDLPEEVKSALEHRSLELLKHVVKDIVVVGGWAARAWGGKTHLRYTYDIDGVADEEGLEKAHEKLTDLKLSPQKTEWGYIYTSPSRVRGAPDDILIKIELSPLKIYDIDGVHYFSFDMKRVKQKIVESIDGKFKMEITVPEVEYLTVNKLGLAASFKNEYDVGTLIGMCDVHKLVEIIQATNRWRGRVLERAPVMLNHLKSPSSIPHRELSKTIDVDQACERIERVLAALRTSPQSVYDRAEGMPSPVGLKRSIPPQHIRITPRRERCMLRPFTMDVLSRIRDLRGEAYPGLLREGMGKEYEHIYYHVHMLIRQGYVTARKALGPRGKWALKLRITPAGEEALRRAVGGG